MSNPRSIKRRKRIVLWSIVLLVVALACVAIFKPKEAVITITKEKVARRNLTEVVVANGKIQPVLQVTLSPEVSGEIIELAKEGQAVNKGDVLVKIKPDPYIASQKSAEANCKMSIASQRSSEAGLEKADLDHKRYEELRKHLLVSESDYQVAKTAYDVAVATLAGSVQQVEMAQAQLARANDDLSKTTIYSPITGTVTKLYSQVGERVVGTATMAGTDIMIVSDLNEMETRVDIGEVDVVLIHVGETAKLDVDAFKDRKFTGVVTEIANSAKGSTGSTSAAAAAASSSATQEATKFEVKIRIAEKERFRPGMSVTADIETRSRTNVLTVPIQSVTLRTPKDAFGKTNTVTVAANDPAVGLARNGGPEKKKASDAQEVVFVVDGDHVRMVTVKKGIADDDYYEIIDGLKEGDEVVSGNSKAIRDELEDGKKVATDAMKNSFDKKN